MPSVHPPRKLSLLDLPPELRSEIWTVFYTVVCPPRIIYHEDHYKGDGVTKKHLISFAIASTCRRLHAEIWPVIWHHVELHLTRNICAWYHHKLPPSWQRKKIRRIVWYITVDSYNEDHMIPFDPAPLWRFPALESFMFCSAMWVGIEEMSLITETVPMTEDRPRAIDQFEIAQAVEAYRTMDPENRIAQWQSLRWVDGKSLIERLFHILDREHDNSWLRILLCHEEVETSTASNVHHIADSKKEDDDDDQFVEWDKAIEMMGAVAKRIQVSLRLELVLSQKFENENRRIIGPSEAARVPILCLIDASRRSIVEMRQPALGAYRDELDLNMSAVGDWQ